MKLSVSSTKSCHLSGLAAVDPGTGSATCWWYWLQNNRMRCRWYGEANVFTLYYPVELQSLPLGAFLFDSLYLPLCLCDKWPQVELSFGLEIIWLIAPGSDQMATLPSSFTSSGPRHSLFWDRGQELIECEYLQVWVWEYGLRMVNECPHSKFV